MRFGVEVTKNKEIKEGIVKECKDTNKEETNILGGPSHSARIYPSQMSAFFYIFPFCGKVP